MATVLFYSFILFSSTFFVYVAEKERTQIGRIFFCGLAFLLVFIPSAIRYDVGTDYLNYLEIFNGSNPSNNFESYRTREPLFYFINWFLKNIGAHFQWLFVVFSFLISIIAFKAYPTKNAWLIHFLFFSSLWIASFNIMRQVLAITWCFLALVSFFNKNYRSFFVLTIIGSLFHQSALFIIISGLIALIPLKNNLKIKAIPLFFIIFIIFTFLSMSIILVYVEQLLQFLGFANYVYYFSSIKYFKLRDFGSGFGVLAKVLFSIYLIINTKQFLKINKNYWIVIILVFLYSLGTALANQIIIFGRMATTFEIAPIIGAYLLTQIKTNKKIHYFVLTCFLIFLTLISVSFGKSIGNSKPKLNPYQTIFMEIYR